MLNRLRTCGVPLGTFALALVLSWAAGPASGAFSLRQSSGSTGSCTVAISGPDKLCTDSTATYTAKGVPAGGTCVWELIDSAGVTIDSQENCTVTIKADKTVTIAEFKLKVTYSVDGKTCTDTITKPVLDLIVIPVCVRLLRNSDDTNGTAVTPAQVQGKLDQANEIWKECCIRWELKKDEDGAPEIDKVRTPKGLDKLANSIAVKREAGGSQSPGFQAVNQIDHHDGCVNVMFVKQLDPSQGFTTRPNYPKDRTKPPGGLKQAGTAVDDAANGNALAHELGHQLGLGHATPGGNLMSQGATGSELTEEQCDFARTSAKLLLQALGK